jgi:carboxypeptidase C (cathepsin A)
MMRLFTLAALVLLALAGPARAQQPLVAGDETIVVTKHRIQTAQGPLEYEARAGRIAIRHDETGQVRAHIFFIAYVVKPKDGVRRPLSFVWNGGPESNALLLHLEQFGPRLIDGDHFIDNPETLLGTSDLVFYDPVGTGFSRAAVPDFDGEFLTVLGDMAATTEFIRAYRAKFGAEDQKLFLIGESSGTWRASGVAETMAKRGQKIAGTVLISGGVPGSQMSNQFTDAMYILPRTASAFALKKLAPDLLRDKAATMKAADTWAYEVYLPALERVAQLNDGEREQIAQELARFTGVRPDQVDRKTLVMTNLAFRNGLFDGDKSKALSMYDMRSWAPRTDFDAGAVGRYLRDDLGYRTDLAYYPQESGYMPQPGPARRTNLSRYVYNHTELPPDANARMAAGAGPPASLPWLQNAMRADRDLRVMVAAGRYDSLNMCEANPRMTGKLEPELSARFAHYCYEGGHAMYQHDPAVRRQLAGDVARFVRETAARSTGK